MNSKILLILMLPLVQSVYCQSKSVVTVRKSSDSIPGSLDRKKVMISSVSKDSIMLSHGDLAPSKQLPQNVLFIVNGKAIKPSELPAPDAIKEIRVYKGSDAIRKFGQVAADGAVEILLKDPPSPKPLNANNSGAPKVFEKAPYFSGYKFDLPAFFKANYKPVLNESGTELQGVIAVKFVLDAKGNLENFKLSSVETANDLNVQKMFDEVVRVLKLTKPIDWEPAIQGGHRVNSWITERFEF